MPGSDLPEPGFQCLVRRVLLMRPKPHRADRDAGASLLAEIVKSKGTGRCLKRLPTGRIDDPFGRNGTIGPWPWLKSAGSIALLVGRHGSGRVGFGRHFSVKLQGYGLPKTLPGRIPTTLSASKSSRKLFRRVKPPRVMKITLNDPECIQTFKIGLRPAQVASGFWVIAARTRATHLASGRCSRPAKLEYRCDRIQ